jgi:Relaxase/Mobilisation nuclease domain
MIPKVPKTGTSFLGAWNYYAHDKRSAEQKAQGEALISAERVAWTHSENLFGFDANRAAIALMSDTAHLNKHCKKPVYAFSLAWHPEQKPTKEQMIEAGNAALKVLGMEEHQALFIAHKDTDHAHVHIMVNRVHPETLKAKNNYRDFKRLSEWARGFEREHGKIYCAAREAKAVAAEQDSAKAKAQHYADHVILQAWNTSDGGKSFAAALKAKGWTFGLGDRKDRFLALTPSGKPLDILREINKTRDKGDKLKLADIEKRFADLKREDLKKIAALQKEQEAERIEKKRREEFKKQGEKEASKAFHKAADDERHQIERLHRELRLQHTEQQRIHQEAALRQRQEAQQAIKDTYAHPEQAKNLKALYARQNAKATIWGKLSGKHGREQAALSEQIKQQRRQIDESQRKAELHHQHVESLIREDADDLARRQEIDRHALPPIPPDRSKAKEQEQQRPQFERSPEREQGLDL